jgi:hypothetical protein
MSEPKESRKHRTELSMTKNQASKNKRKFNHTPLVLECAVVAVVKKKSEKVE